MASADRRRDALRAVLQIPYCPFTPTSSQAQFLLDQNDEALYGGAAGPGKSVGLLMAALQWMDIPGYSALILRQNLGQLRLPNGLIAVAHSWLKGTAARWLPDDYTWLFPSGARLVFGYLENEGDERRYQGSEFQFVGFDELTEFPENAYLYLFSRLRGPADGELAKVPLRMRATTNPGGPGHEWVRRRFIQPWQEAQTTGQPPERSFHPAKLTDNPYLDVERYRKQLGRLDPITRAQLRDGNWDIRPAGRLFQAAWFAVIRACDVPDGCSRVRYWDLAATPDKPGTDPDYTVGVLVAHDHVSGIYYVEDVVRLRGRPAEVEQCIRSTAERDGPEVLIYFEQEPGSAGVAVIDHYRRDVLDGYAVRAHKPSGSKLVRAQPVAARAEPGDIKIVEGSWNDVFLDEIALFPDVAHDDQVDALVGAMTELGGVQPTPVYLVATRLTCPSPWRRAG